MPQVKERKLLGLTHWQKNQNMGYGFLRFELFHEWFRDWGKFGGEAECQSGVSGTGLDILYCHSTSLKRSRLMTASNLNYNGLSYETEVYLDKHSSPLEDASVVEKGKKDD